MCSRTERSAVLILEVRVSHFFPFFPLSCSFKARLLISGEHWKLADRIIHPAFLLYVFGAAPPKPACLPYLLSVYSPWKEAPQPLSARLYHQRSPQWRSYCHGTKASGFYFYFFKCFYDLFPFSFPKFDCFVCVQHPLISYKTPPLPQLWQYLWDSFV